MAQTVGSKTLKVKKSAKQQDKEAAAKTAVAQKEKNLKKTAAKRKSQSVPGSSKRPAGGDESVAPTGTVQRIQKRKPLLGSDSEDEAPVKKKCKVTIAKHQNERQKGKKKKVLAAEMDETLWIDDEDDDDPVPPVPAVPASNPHKKGTLKWHQHNLRTSLTLVPTWQC